VTSREFRERLTRRARRANTPLNADWIAPLEIYFDLLARWNAKINLTALPLQEPTDQTFDRLFIEPLAAARHVQNEPDSWCDLGSGGGSPAIPLKIARSVLSLTMIEGKARKAAFLREAVRVLQLDNSDVLQKRFDEVVAMPAAIGSQGIVTVRAVRADHTLFGIAGSLLRREGRLLLFRPSDRPISSDGFRYVESSVLIEAPRTYLSVLARVFHVEQHG
jgi:16S rRNA (guanine(527)-N(7))-methyltransferase RsmG